ncbi:hypothetical protein Tcan_05616 [Toxocara canis]|uniref:DUF7517 domain-containing protein n=1 Tax=Toxocara canis TaxID=6265 RepID=A0A0B2URT3_TOXCA|nr:hypothetical protein Tcan_05616 [Toxocara canis]
MNWDGDGSADASSDDGQDAVNNAGPTPANEGGFACVPNTKATTTRGAGSTKWGGDTAKYTGDEESEDSSDSYFKGEGGRSKKGKVSHRSRQRTVAELRLTWTCRKGVDGDAALPKRTGVGFAAAQYSDIKKQTNMRRQASPNQEATMNWDGDGSADASSDDGQDAVNNAGPTPANEGGFACVPNTKATTTRGAGSTKWGGDTAKYTGDEESEDSSDSYFKGEGGRSKKGKVSHRSRQRTVAESKQIPSALEERTLLNSGRCRAVTNEDLSRSQSTSPSGIRGSRSGERCGSPRSQSTRRKSTAERSLQKSIEQSKLRRTIQQSEAMWRQQPGASSPIPSTRRKSTAERSLQKSIEQSKLRRTIQQSEAMWRQQPGASSPIPESKERRDLAGVPRGFADELVRREGGTHQGAGMPRLLNEPPYLHRDQNRSSHPLNLSSPSDERYGRQQSRSAHANSPLEPGIAHHYELVRREGGTHQGAGMPRLLNEPPYLHRDQNRSSHPLNLSSPSDERYGRQQSRSAHANSPLEPGIAHHYELVRREGGTHQGAGMPRPLNEPPYLHRDQNRSSHPLNLSSPSDERYGRQQSRSAHANSPLEPGIAHHYAEADRNFRSDASASASRSPSGLYGQNYFRRCGDDYPVLGNDNQQFLRDTAGSARQYDAFSMSSFGSNDRLKNAATQTDDGWLEVALEELEVIGSSSNHSHLGSSASSLTNVTGPDADVAILATVVELIVELHAPRPVLISDLPKLVGNVYGEAIDPVEDRKYRISWHRLIDNYCHGRVKICQIPGHEASAYYCNIAQGGSRLQLAQLAALKNVCCFLVDHFWDCLGHRHGVLWNILSSERDIFVRNQDGGRAGDEDIHQNLKEFKEEGEGVDFVQYRHMTAGLRLMLALWSTIGTESEGSVSL